MIQPITKITEEQEIYMLNITNEVKRGTLVEIHISDLHFGVMDPKYQYDILEEQFLSKIEGIYFDLICIDGDLFDHKFMSNSDVVMYATRFFNRLVGICRDKKATLMIIHGTLLHDANQLKLFYHYMTDPTVDVRVIEKVQFEYIKGSRILCIPELYGMGAEYYKYFLFNSGYYDSVFMHGEMLGSIYKGEKTEPTLDSTKSPVFCIDDFRMCLGPIISGHVHTAGCYEKYFYYCGSPYRWRFGEEAEKGFLIVLHNLDTFQHYVHLEPIKSYRYDTISLDDLLYTDPKETIGYINNLQQNGVDYIRLEFNREMTDDTISKLELIKNYFKTNSNIKFNIKNKDKKQTMKENAKMMDKYQQYKYVLDKSLSEYQILSRYINDQMGHEYISSKELEELLNEAI